MRNDKDAVSEYESLREEFRSSARTIPYSLDIAGVAAMLATFAMRFAKAAGARAQLFYFLAQIGDIGDEGSITEFRHGEIQHSLDMLPSALPAIEKKLLMPGIVATDCFTPGNPLGEKFLPGRPESLALFTEFLGYGAVTDLAFIRRPPEIDLDKGAFKLIESTMANVERCRAWGVDPTMRVVTKMSKSSISDACRVLELKLPSRELLGVASRGRA